MGFFRNVINSVKNMYLVNSKLKPFLSDLLWKLNSIVIIPEKIDVGVIDAYQIVSTTEPEKYKDILSEYVSNTSRIKEHNEVVSDIQQRVLGFDYQEILSNPYSFTKEKMESYSKFAELVNSFAHVGTTFQKFLNEFWDIEENYDDIVEQFELIPRTIPQLLSSCK